MSITNKIFLDSSFFVESQKGRNPQFFDFVTEHNALDCCISDVVCSEYWFHLFGILGGKAPLTLKEAGLVSSIAVDHAESFSFFERYTLLDANLRSLALSVQSIQDYNLLPNDALIFGLCLLVKIPFLASYDSDFEAPCHAEGITLVTPENYLQVLPKP